MSVITPEGLSPYDSSTEETISALIEIVERQSETIEELSGRITELEEQVDDNTEEIDELEQSPTVDWDSNDHTELSVTSTTGATFPLGKSISSKVSETELEEQVEASNPKGSTGEDTTAEPSVTPETPLEQITALPQNMIDDESANVRRAVFVAQDVADYSKKVPAGRAIKSSDLRKVLKAGTDCSGHTETVSRVLSVLDDLGGEGVKVVDRRGEKRVIFSQEATERLEQLSDATGGNHAVVIGNQVGT